MAIPTTSIPQSSAEPTRPSTNDWCHSSLAAYASAIAAAAAGIASARCHSHQSRPNSAMWAVLRKTVSQTPRPEFRSAWAESAKMTHMSARGGM
jgi:hypothetical protein